MHGTPVCGREATRPHHCTPDARAAEGPEDGGRRAETILDVTVLPPPTPASSQGALLALESGNHKGQQVPGQRLPHLSRSQNETLLWQNPCYKFRKPQTTADWQGPSVC